MFPFDTDIHSHVIPGVDDGSQSMEQSLAIIRRLHANGIRHLYCTPHINPEMFSVPVEKLRSGFDSLVNAVAETGIDMELRLAAEYMVHEGFLEQDFSDKSKFLTFDGEHILIEMSYLFESHNIKDAIYELNVAGFSPILAHPERYTFYYDNMKRIKELAAMDCELQLNMASLGGKYGKHSLKVIDYLLDNKLYSYIGTDSHTQGQVQTMEEIRIKNKLADRLLPLAGNNKRLWAGA